MKRCCLGGCEAREESRRNGLGGEGALQGRTTHWSHLKKCFVLYC